jgi:hypothetical protein
MQSQAEQLQTQTARLQTIETQIQQIQTNREQENNIVTHMDIRFDQLAAHMQSHVDERVDELAQTVYFKENEAKIRTAENRELQQRLQSLEHKTGELTTNK